MKFILEVDLTAGAMPEDSLAELGRILRYWGGNLKYFDLEPGDRSEILDSGYDEVGEWRILGEGADDG